MNYLDKLSGDKRDSIVSFCNNWRKTLPEPCTKPKVGKPALFLEDICGGPEKLLSLAALGWEWLEIASELGVGYTTIRKWKKTDEYSPLFIYANTLIGAYMGKHSRLQIENPNRAFNSHHFLHTYSLRTRFLKNGYLNKLDNPSEMAKGVMQQHLEGLTSVEEMSAQMTALRVYGEITAFEDLEKRLKTIEISLEDY